MSLQEETIFIQKDKDKQLDFIEKYMKFITSSVYNVLGKTISKEDDEFSVALAAFNDAIMQFNPDEGDFYDYAESFIHNRLSEKFGTGQETVAASDEEQEAEVLEIDTEIYKPGVGEETVIEPNVQDVEIKVPDTEGELQDEVVDIDINSEIESFAKQLKKMQITFSDLAQCSPKKKKTQDRILDAAVYVINNNAAKQMVLDEGILPVSKILDNTKVDRKTLDKHRKYIIAYIVVLVGDYPGLSKYITGEQGDEI